jgi:hypothetical protein
MHTRRMAAFLLGCWLGCSLLMILIQLENLSFTRSLLSAPSNQAAEFMKQAGPQQNAELLMRYQAAEQNRSYSYIWEEAQFVLAVSLGCCLFLGTQKRIFPLVVCGMMLLLVVFEHAGITPELAFRGRAADFPPGSTAYSVQVRVWQFDQIYAGVEGTKLLLGVLLAGYLFIFRARRTRKQISAIDSPQPARIIDE